MNRFALAAVMSAPLMACAASLHTVPDATAYPERYVAEAPQGAVAGPFWAQFSDPVLKDFLRRAEGANGDIRVALSRIAQARALVTGSTAALLPNTEATGQALTRRNSAASGASFGPRDLDLFDADFDATWELDLFGRLRAQRQADVQDAKAARLDSEAVRISVMAETARLYFSVRSLQSRLNLVERSAVAQQDLADLVSARANAGLVSQIDVVQAEALAASTLARTHQLNAQLADSRAALALILGTTVSEIEPALRSAPVWPQIVAQPLGRPGDVLENRYDVRRDIARLEAADARTAARVRDRLPRLTLIGSAGSGAEAVDSLFTSEATQYSLAAGLTAPILDFGRKKALTNQARAQADERAAVLETTILKAIGEVERDAVASQARTAQLRLTANQLARDLTAQALLRERYIAGLENFSRVLDAERQALDSGESEVSAREAQIAAALALWKSLGGA